MPPISLDLAKQFLMVSHNAQDLVIQSIIDGALDAINRHCWARLADDAETEAVKQAVYASNGRMVLGHLPVLGVVDVCDSSGTSAGNYLATTNMLIGDFADGWYEVVYYGGYTSETYPKGMTAIALECIRRLYGARDTDAKPGTQTMAGLLQPDGDIFKMLAPFRLAYTGVA